MLNSVNLNDKTYEELLAEAISQIPLYSKEWTNFNASDPGITILQNLTAFQLLQQESLNEITDELRRKLLKLVGLTARENAPATLLLQAPAQGGETLPDGYRLWSGSLPFETVGSVDLNPWGLQAVYAGHGSRYRDITHLLNPTNASFAYLVGKRADAGETLTCVLSGIPEVGEPLRFWVQPAEESLRTPFLEDEGPVFAVARWQYYTAAGWQDATVLDESRGFLQAGQIILTLDGDTPAVLTETPVAGCAVRCVLDAADYDRPPRLLTLAAHLFPVVQQETRAKCFCFPGGFQAELRGALAARGHFYVFCREGEDEPYRQYREAPFDGAQGRYYQREETLSGVRLLFSAMAFGFAPGQGADAIRVSCFDEEMIHHRALGTALGYENQVIDLDLVENVLPDRFSLAVEVPEPEGPSGWYFVAPEDPDPDSLGYRVLSQEGKLVIRHAGFGGDCRLYLCDCATTQGSRGNVRACTTVEHRGGYDGTEVDRRFFSPAPAWGGVSYETAEALRLRFAAQMRTVSAAATTEDYENLVLHTPGLCIHKVRAVAVGEKNLVRVAVKPYTEEEYPSLSQSYLRQIHDFLEPRRMLTTRFELEQPRYVPVSVNATLCVRGVTAHAQAEAEAMLRQALDHVNGPQNFGGWVRFNDIYQQLNALPFVEAVDALTLFPEGKDAVLVGSDIRLDEYSLCHPGVITLTLRSHGQ